MLRYIGLVLTPINGISALTTLFFARKTQKIMSYLLISIVMLTVSAVYGSDSTAKSVKSSVTKPETKTDLSEWEKVIEVAKKEGKIVMSGDPSELWRKSLVDMFHEDYPDIKVEYTGAYARDFWPRLRKERELGKKLWDLVATGTTTAYEFKRDGFLEPIRPLLLPENAGDSKWIGGLDGLFSDQEKKFMPTYTIYIQRTTAVNRDFIKESELKSSGQLLNPKFKDKIVIQTPTSGASFSALANLGVMYGEKFLRDLLTKQNVVVTGDNRQQTEWVVRGKYPIAIGFNEYQLIPFQKQGLGRNVTQLEDKITPVAAGLGGIFLFTEAPHPNAARVYINWLLSQRTQLKLSKNVLLNSLRTDVPPVDKESAVDPAHLSNYRLYYTEENVEISQRFSTLIRESSKH